MNFNLITILDTPSEGILPGSKEYDFAGAGLTAFVSILIVFAVLLIIIGATHGLFWSMNKINQRIDKSNSKFARFLKRKRNKNNQVAPKNEANEKVEIIDDDMMAAVLAATIDYQAEVKSDVRLVSVKEIKSDENL